MGELDNFFKHHPVKAKSISWIELHFPDGSTKAILPQQPVRGITHNSQRPCSFLWHNSGGTAVTPRLIKWIEIEFKHIFSMDTFLWNVSSQSAPEKLLTVLTRDINL